jgi:hypothetical protein
MDEEGVVGEEGEGVELGGGWCVSWVGSGAAVGDVGLNDGNGDEYRDGGEDDDDEVFDE